MAKIKTLGDWCKFLEKNFSPEILVPKLPIIIRLDGVNFSTWTKDLKKPFDTDLNNIMIEFTKFLVNETNAVIGYTQSDEITLVLYGSDIASDIYQGGRKSKILSKLTGKGIIFFNELVKKYFPKKKPANFDCRVYQVPTLEDACSQLLWRELDATKNSKSMLAQAYFPHGELKYLNGDQLQDKLMTERGINWNDLPNKFKRGVYVQKIETERRFTASEIDNLPVRHKARHNPDFVFYRKETLVLDMPVFTKIINKVDVIFNKKKPEIFSYDENLIN